MPALNFQARFVPLIQSGEKTQTIRALRKDGRMPCKPGDQLKLYTGMRTKRCQLVDTVRVVSVRRITLRMSRNYLVADIGEWRDLSARTMNELARRDGFSSIFRLFDFFRTTHGLPFEGWVIRW